MAAAGAVVPSHRRTRFGGVDMSSPSRSQLEQALRQFRDPGLASELAGDLVFQGGLRELVVDGGEVRAKVVLGYPVATPREALEQELTRTLEAVPGEIGRASCRERGDGAAVAGCRKEHVAAPCLGGVMIRGSLVD